MLKKIFIIISLYLSLIFSVNANIDIKARTAILQDFLSGEILYEKEPNLSICFNLELDSFIRDFNVLKN